MKVLMIIFLINKNKIYILRLKFVFFKLISEEKNLDKLKT